MPKGYYYYEAVSVNQHRTYMDMLTTTFPYYFKVSFRYFGFLSVSLGTGRKVQVWRDDRFSMILYVHENGWQLQIF